MLKNSWWYMLKEFSHSILLINLNNFIAYVSLLSGRGTYIMIMSTGKLFY